MTLTHPAAQLAPPTFISGFGNPTLNPSASATAPLLIHTSPHKTDLAFQTCTLISLLRINTLY